MSTGDGERRLRVVVCGTIFGQVYLEAFRKPHIPFELAGILSRGSERSRLCARLHNVPLFTSSEELPTDIDVACVVIRSGLLGGSGTELALKLMARGIHVLQEHPLHHDELAECLRQARRCDVVYHLNSFYVHVEQVRRFLAAARELLRRQPPLFVEAACSFQVAYALFDILGQVLGGVRPWSLSAQAAPPGAPRLGEAASPFRSLEGTIAGVPVLVRVQNQLDPSDPDNHAHLLHRITVGTESGSLSLVDTHGPTVWTARPHFPREVRQEGGQPHFADANIRTPPTEQLEGPALAAISTPTTASYREIFESLWPAGVRQALHQLRGAIADRSESVRRGQYHLALCQLWQDATARLGPPELVRGRESRVLSGEDLAAITRAANKVTVDQ